jgi:hypothetical protein
MHFVIGEIVKMKIIFKLAEIVAAITAIVMIIPIAIFFGIYAGVMACIETIKEGY